MEGYLQDVDSGSRPGRLDRVLRFSQPSIHEPVGLLLSHLPLLVCDDF